MNDAITFRIPAFSIPYSGKWLTDTLRLNQFQATLHALLGHSRDVLVTAPTGGGKTLTLLLNSDSGSAAPGFVAIYPNNTLLLNQLCTVEDIIVEHFGATLVETLDICEERRCKDPAHDVVRRCECLEKGNMRDCIEPLSIYALDEHRLGGEWGGARYIALFTLSGRYLVSEEGVPKREALYRIAQKTLSYRRKGGIYSVIFATPDTYLLVLTGAYRDFEGVGKTLHNMLLALAEGKDLETVLRRTGVLARGVVDETVTVVQRLLNQPLFIDEFHLYGPYEVDALHATLKLYKELIGKPVVFSSATPAEDILGELTDTGVKPEHVKAETVRGTKGFVVRGNTEFVLIPAPVKKRGMTAFFRAGEEVPNIVKGMLMDELRELRDGRALIILERLWMVSELARGLASDGLDVECIASIIPRDVCRPGSKVIVGSEATTQGVNLGKIVLGITAGTSSEDVIQRIGRVGRRGVDSRVYLVLPENVLGQSSWRDEMDYWRLVEVLKTLYPDYPKRKRDVSRLIPGDYHGMRRKLIRALGIASVARVSGMSSLYNRIGIAKDEAEKLLESVVGPPIALVRLLLFRRTGFSVKYLVADTGERGEASIGLITRNFDIRSVTRDGRLVILLTKARTPLRVTVLGDPSPYSGKFVGLRSFLEQVVGRIEIGEGLVLNPDTAGDTLVYVVDAGEELSEYLSYTGEGAEVKSASGRRYAVVFV